MRVVLVDEHDRMIGSEEKLRAHELGRLHRAFSIFVFNKEGALLLQRRAASKYHSGGLWTNTCCSHPRLDEPTEAAAHRRLREEMGFGCPLEKAFTFVYRADVGGGLVEHEFLHVYLGEYDGDPNLNPEEADAFKWISLDELFDDVRKHPEKYTAWFRIILEKHKDKIGSLRV